jgi:carbonic anhydrase/acetyltransferase-like protein (isoleucine patch superfamily)
LCRPTLRFGGGAAPGPDPAYATPKDRSKNRDAFNGAIGAIILNGVTVGRGCLIGANTFLPEGKEIPDNSVVLGAPGKVVREVTDKDRAMMARPIPGYVQRWPQYRDKLRPIG